MKWCSAPLILTTAFNRSRLVPTDLGHPLLVLHCSYSVLGTWCRPMFAQRVFKASPPQFKPYAISACMLLVLSGRCPCATCAPPSCCLCAACALPVLRMHTAGALPVRSHALPCPPLCTALRASVRCLCAAKHASVRCHARLRALPCALPVRGQACLCALPCAPPCAAMRASVRCHARLCALPCAPLCFRLWATCTSLSPCPVFPPRLLARPCPQGLGGVRPWPSHGPPISLRTCSPLKEHFKPFPDFPEETSEVAEEV